MELVLAKIGVNPGQLKNGGHKPWAQSQGLPRPLGSQDLGDKAAGLPFASRRTFCRPQSVRRQTSKASIVAANPCFLQNVRILSPSWASLGVMHQRYPRWAIH